MHFEAEEGIIGLAIGDALGVPVEMVKRNVLKQNPVKEMLGYGSHNMPAGSWSDDTSMVLATIDAINKTGEIVPDDIAQNFVDWVDESKYTPTGKFFGSGRTCMAAIQNYREKVASAVECGIDDEKARANGSLMRILPVAYCYYAQMDDNIDSQKLYDMVKTFSSITHKNEVCIMGCYIYVLFAVALLNGCGMKIAYDVIKKADYHLFSKECIEFYSRILKGDISKLDEAEIKTTPYVVYTLEATLWSFLTTKSYNESVLKAVNLGGDADTVAACVGGLAGMYYGLHSIDKEWKMTLIKYNYIISLCDEFNKVLKNMSNASK